ncbi:MAG: dethiobiotin synthase [Cyanobacteria bacterium P01_H01_bin.15]
MSSLLIAGTDTDVGKTILTVALAHYWQTYRAESPLGLLKLMQTGIGDRETYESLFKDCSNIEIAVPVQYAAPLAPSLSAAKEGKMVDLVPVWQRLCQLQAEKKFVLAEALGGLGSPVTDELTVADLARDWRLPTVLVVPIKLGSLAQTIANVALARQSNVNLIGIVLNSLTPESQAQQADLTPSDLITQFTGIPVLGTLPYLEFGKTEPWVQAASNLALEPMGLA